MVISRLQEVETHFLEVERALSDPNVSNDPSELQRLGKLHAELSPIIEAYRTLRDTMQGIADAEAMLADPELHDMAQEELNELRSRVDDQQKHLTLMLLPTDPNDDKNVILEIRAGTGGEEAALFAGDLLRMYMRYADRRHWKYDLLSVDETGIGGYKEAVLNIQGQAAYSQLKFESGTHRVQRVPATETSGRIHTSAATVAVLPEADVVSVDIKQDDLHIETYRSSGAGGQNVQKNETAIRITHKPTGMVVTCQDERSQGQNKLKAMIIIASRLQEQAEAAASADRTADRKSQIGSGDRSDKIRTYNYPQGRITDHRIGFSSYNLAGVMDGDIQEFIDALIADDQAKKLQSTED
ncbi:MAG: peptide chain release factor 1 [Armatimonadota bacterium]